MKPQDILLILLTATLLGYFLLPIYHLTTMSLKTGVEAFASPPVWLFSPNLESYRGLLGGQFPRYLGNSLIVSTGNVLLSLLVGMPAAFALSRAQLRGRQVLLFAILATRMLPPIALALPVFLVYHTLGLLDSRLGLILIFLTFNLPLMIWLLKGFFDDVPSELLDAARIDGATIFKAFTRVAVPYIAPGILACAILAWIYAWNEFTFSLILARREAITATVALASFFDFERVAWGSIAAGGTLTIMPVVFFSILGRRYLVRGLTGGALKG